MKLRVHHPRAHPAAAADRHLFCLVFAPCSRAPHTLPDGVPPPPAAHARPHRRRRLRHGPDAAVVVHVHFQRKHQPRGPALPAAPVRVRVPPRGGAVRRGRRGRGCVGGGQARRDGGRGRVRRRGSARGRIRRGGAVALRGRRGTGALCTCDPRLRPALALVGLHLRALPPSALRSRWSAPTSAPMTLGSALLRSRWSASTAAFSPRPHEHDATEPMDPIPETPALPSAPLALVLLHALLHPLRARRCRLVQDVLLPRRAPLLPAPQLQEAARSTPQIRRRRRQIVRLRIHGAVRQPARARAPDESATVLPPRKKQRKLTVADVQVHLPVVGAPPATPSVLACASPDVFSTAFSPVPMTPATPGGQWAAYPALPPPAPALRPLGTSAGASEALYAAYTTQRSPRRRVSNASSASGWSSPSRGAGSSGSSGARTRGTRRASAGARGAGRTRG